jgi:hypothetical protein
VEILLRNGANINEKDVSNISVQETDDREKISLFEKQLISKERERAENERKEMREGDD